MTWRIEEYENNISERSIRVIDHLGNVVADNEPYYPQEITQAHAETIVSAVNEVDELREQLATARAALRTIEAWKLPSTGKFWPNTDGSNTDSDRPMSYGACYGSNGERDYMRAVASQALE